MTRDGFGAYRLWGRTDDEHTPLISRGGRLGGRLRLGNLQRIIAAVCGLAGLVALACIYAPAWRDSEVESKISSALGKQGGRTWGETKISPTQSPTQCSLRFSGATIFSLNNHQSLSRVDLSKDGTIKWNNGAKGHHWMSLSGIYISNGRQLLPLSNGWRHYNAPGGHYAPAEYSCAGGLVAVSGLVRAGNYNSPIGTLPSGCRPKKNLIFSVNNSAKQARVDVYTDGTIKWVAGGKDGGWVSLSGIVFSTTTDALLPLSNGWRHYSAPPNGYWAPAEYSCAEGLVVVSGLVSAGNYNSPIGTLPPVCRPKKNLIFSVNNHAKQARVDVYTDGTIKWVAGGKDHNWVSLSGIVFSTTTATTDALLPLSNGWKQYNDPPNGYWAPAQVHCARGLTVVQGLIKGGSWSATMATITEKEEETISHIPMLATHNAGTGYFAGATSFREGALVNQMTDLVTQLNCGVRAFDFRIGTYKYSAADVLHVIPSVTTGLVTGGFKQTLQMVKRGPGETTPVLFLHGKGGFAFIPEDHATVESAMTYVVAWAMGHPSELLVFMLKQCQVCEECSPGTIGVADAMLKDSHPLKCGCELKNKCAESDLMAPIKKLGIPIMKNCDYTKWNRAKLMDEAKMDNGAHILVVSGTDYPDETGNCIVENYDAGIQRLRADYEECDSPKEDDKTCGTKEITDIKTWHDKKTDFERLDGYFDASLKKYGDLTGKPYWLQAYWQQLETAEAQVAYGTGLKSDMVEATTESKINYHVLDYLKRKGNRDRVSIVSVNEVCHAGPEIAELLGTTVSAADKAKCKASCEAKKLGNRPVDEACSKDWQCQSQMCGFTQAGAHETKCCPQGKELTMYAGRDYCTPFSDGAKCWSDAQCKSKYCPGNGGVALPVGIGEIGSQKGTCVTKFSKKKGDACVSNAECESKACGRATAASGAKTQCCEHGYTTFGGYDYCTKMPDGAVCWSDAMCSGVCKGNHGGLARGKCFTLYSRADNARCSSNDECRSRYCRSGKCFTKKGDWASCPAQNSYCRKGNCNRTTRHGTYKCCPRGTFWCGPWTSGDCKSGFYYCKGKLGH